MERGAESYLIAVSGGPARCSEGDAGVSDDVYEQETQHLAALARMLRDGLGIQTIPVGYGEETDSFQLNAIAASGGSSHDQYVPARDRHALAEALTSIVTDTITCEFGIELVMPEREPPTPVDWADLEFYLGGALVPRDPGCQRGTGWHWTVENERLALCEKSCEYAREEGRSP